MDKKPCKISISEKRETHEKSLWFLWPFAESQFPYWRSKDSWLWSHHAEGAESRAPGSWKGWNLQGSVSEKFAERGPHKLVSKGWVYILGKTSIIFLIEFPTKVEVKEMLEVEHHWEQGNVGVCWSSSPSWMEISRNTTPKEQGAQWLGCVQLFATPRTVAMDRFLCPWDFPGKNTGVGYHFLLQVIFLTQGSNQVASVSCTGRQILHHCTTWEVL